MPRSASSDARDTQAQAGSAHTASAGPQAVAAPPYWMLALEFRAFWEFGAVLPAWPLLQTAPRGDGHGVIVFPGLAASDQSTAPLRRYIEGLGYRCTGWEQGTNFGPRAGVLEVARQKVLELAEETGGPVSLIGWSLGGIYARELAKAHPDAARCVITLGTPFSCPPRATNAWRLYELTSGRHVEVESQNYDLPTAPPVPTTSIYSRTDGIVPWRGSVQAPELGHDRVENIEVLASHFGIGLNPAAWWAVADRLAQDPEHWVPFATANDAPPAKPRRARDAVKRMTKKVVYPRRQRSA